VKKDTNNNNSKQANKNPQFDELQLSDDDDFPDEQEILKTTGLLSLKKPANGPVGSKISFKKHTFFLEFRNRSLFKHHLCLQCNLINLPWLIPQHNSNLPAHQKHQ
jgi:hypothetical protein